MRATQAHALRALDCESVAGALTDEPSLVLCGARDDVRSELAHGRGRIYAEVKADDGPAALARTIEQPAEVSNGAGQPVELCHDEHRGLAAVEAVKRRLQRGTAQVLRRQALLDNKFKLPAAALCLRAKGGALGVEAEAGRRLLVGADTHVPEDSRLLHVSTVR